MNNMEKNYIWTATEFAILLSIYGADDVFMFPLPAKESVEREVFLRAIYSLVESGYIKPTYGSEQPYALSDDVRSCISPLVEAEKILEFQFKAENTNKLAFGSSNSWTIVEPDNNDMAYRVKHLVGREVLEWFDELPAWSAERLDTDEEIATLSAVDGQIKKDMEMLCAGTIVPQEFIARCDERRNCEKYSRLLIPRGSYLYMLSGHGDMQECCVYTEDLRGRLREELFSLQKEGELE